MCSSWLRSRLGSCSLYITFHQLVCLLNIVYFCIVICVIFPCKHTFCSLWNSTGRYTSSSGIAGFSFPYSMNFYVLPYLSIAETTPVMLQLSANYIILFTASSTMGCSAECIERGCQLTVHPSY